MPIYNVTDRRQTVLWDISRPAVPLGGGRAFAPIHGTVATVGYGETRNFEVNSRFTGLFTERLTACCAVCLILFIDGCMHRVSMHHVPGGDPNRVNWGGLTANMRTPMGSTAIKKIVVAWNEVPDLDLMTQQAFARTSIPQVNIYHYLGNAQTLEGITFAVEWPCYVGELR
jgi:hypothetical protein